MLHLKQYTKRYHGRLILQIPEVSFAQGLHWIKGANGSGKSTLFKSIAGIIPFDGDIELQGVNLKREPVVFRSMTNYSEAEPIFPGFLTSKDLVRFVGKTRKASVAEQDQLCREFGVVDFFHQSCQIFSSGMLKKLSITLAFLGRPKLVILDEPFITLDIRAREVLVEHVRTLLQNGTTILISSHTDLDEGLSADSIFSIEHGGLKHA